MKEHLKFVGPPRKVYLVHHQTVWRSLEGSRLHSRLLLSYSQGCGRLGSATASVIIAALIPQLGANMGDPLSALWVSLGLTSLSFQTVDECVKGTIPHHFEHCVAWTGNIGYQYYVDATNMPEQYHHLLTHEYRKLSRSACSMQNLILL